MGTKNNPGAFDCYANAEPDEPMFVLLARDRHAAALVNLWAAMRRIDAAREPADASKIEEAEQCANDMVAWLVQHREVDPAGIRALAEGLALIAEFCGASLRIDHEPLQPLRMGNYRHSVNIVPRYSRGPDL